MKRNDLTGLDVIDLLQWIKSSRIARLSLDAGGLQLSVDNEIDFAEPATSDRQAPFIEIRAPAAGRFFPAVAPGTELNPDMVIGAVRLVRRQRPVLSGAAGYLSSFEVGPGGAVAYGDVVAVVRPKDAP